MGQPRAEPGHQGQEHGRPDPAPPRHLRSAATVGSSHQQLRLIQLTALPDPVNQLPVFKYRARFRFSGISPALCVCPKIGEAVDAVLAGRGHGSFLANLASHRDGATGRGLKRSELIDAGVSSLAAATHTTSLLLSWTFHLVASQPALQDEAHEEIVAACGP